MTYSVKSLYRCLTKRGKFIGDIRDVKDYLDGSGPIIVWWSDDEDNFGGVGCSILRENK